MAKKNLGDVLNEQIAAQVFKTLDMPLTLAAKIDAIFSEKMEPVFTSIGRAIEVRANAAIKNKYSDGIDADTRNDILDSLGERVAKKLVGAITKELNTPGLLTNEKKLSEALDELADGFRQFTDDDLESVFKSSITDAFKGATARASEREASNKERAADKQKITDLEEKLKELRSENKTLRSEVSRLSQSASRVQPSYDPPSYRPSYGDSRGGKFARPADAAKILNLTKAVKEAFPDAAQADLKASLANPKFLKDMHGPMPARSTLSAPVIHDVKTLTKGAFIVCHGVDKTSSSTASRLIGQDVVAIVKRNDKGPKGEDRYSVLGGYLNLGSEQAAGEQPSEGVVREVKRKVINAEGTPVIDPKPSRLTLIASGIDYDKFVPLSYTGHALELNSRELAQMKQHAKKLTEDEAYRKSVQDKTGEFFTDVTLMPVSEVVKMSREAFACPYEFDAVQQLAEQLKQKAMQTRRE